MYNKIVNTVYLKLRLLQKVLVGDGWLIQCPPINDVFWSMTVQLLDNKRTPFKDYYTTEEMVRNEKKNSLEI